MAAKPKKKSPAKRPAAGTPAATPQKKNSAAKADPKIIAALDGKTVVKEIVVPGKIVNIVIR